MTFVVHAYTDGRHHRVLGGPSEVKGCPEPGRSTIIATIRRKRIAVDEKPASTEHCPSQDADFDKHDDHGVSTKAHLVRRGVPLDVVEVFEILPSRQQPIHDIAILVPAVAAREHKSVHVVE